MQVSTTISVIRAATSVVSAAKNEPAIGFWEVHNESTATVLLLASAHLFRLAKILVDPRPVHRLLTAWLVVGVKSLVPPSTLL
eukprot:5090525-Pleurochrysis_carterae.AAC.3